MNNSLKIVIHKILLLNFTTPTSCFGQGNVFDNATRNNYVNYKKRQ